MGGGSRKARSRHHDEVKRAVHNQKQREGETPNGATLKAAERRASLRAAKNPAKLARVQKTMGSADVAARKHLENWQDPEIPVAELEDAYDPAFELRRATHTASLRDNADIDRFAARAAVSSAGAAANVASWKAGATAKRSGGYSKRRKGVRINAAGQLTTWKRTETLTGEQVQEKEQRDRKLEALPPQLRPGYKSQTAKLGTHTGLKFRGTGKGQGGGHRAPPSKRSRAEISAQTQARLGVTGPHSRGQYLLTIPRGLFSDRALRRMGFGHKPKRCFSFKGPTAKDDARAFAKKMMGWLEKWKKGVGPPPQP